MKVGAAVTVRADPEELRRKSAQVTDCCLVTWASTPRTCGGPEFAGRVSGP